MSLQEVDIVANSDTQDQDSMATRARLRTLLQLAIAIGTRKGLLRKDLHIDIERGKHVTDKRNNR
jgi:hypothetical protein